MKYVRQKGNNDCAVAAFAMVMGITYRKAMEVLHPNIFRKFLWRRCDATTSIPKIIDGYKKLGHNCGYYLYDFREAPRKAILVVKSFYNTGSYHAVVWDPLRKKILDPAGTTAYTEEFCVENYQGMIMIE